MYLSLHVQSGARDDEPVNGPTAWVIQCPPTAHCIQTKRGRCWRTRSRRHRKDVLKERDGAARNLSPGRKAAGTAHFLQKDIIWVARTGDKNVLSGTTCTHDPVWNTLQVHNLSRCHILCCNGLLLSICKHKRGLSQGTNALAPGESQPPAL